MGLGMSINCQYWTFLVLEPPNVCTPDISTEFGVFYHFKMCFYHYILHFLEWCIYRLLYNVSDNAGSGGDDRSYWLSNSLHDILNIATIYTAMFKSVLKLHTVQVHK